ncbi:MAG TPA: hypothetical protein VF326_01580 [Anaerolineaceae bacterium]
MGQTTDARLSGHGWTHGELAGGRSQAGPLSNHLEAWCLRNPAEAQAHPPIASLTRSTSRVNFNSGPER